MYSRVQNLVKKISLLQVRVEFSARLQTSSKHHCLRPSRASILWAPVEDLGGRLAQEGGEGGKGGPGGSIGIPEERKRKERGQKRKKSIK